jgi:hypothetical protein
MAVVHISERATRVVVRSNGTVTLETPGRGKAALRWLEQPQGKKLMQLVNQSGKEVKGRLRTVQPQRGR